jgi:hypothetical protein
MYLFCRKFLNLGFLFILGGGLLVAQAAETPLSQCPDTSQGETAQDCPWAGIARTLGEQIDAHEKVDLKKYAPTLVQQLKSDSKQKDLKELWGESINFDELAKGIIVRPEIVATLSKEFDVAFPAEPSTTPNYDRIVMAGLEHTYGYLFSLLKTAFGYKRARWVQGEVEEGFGFPAGVFSANAPEFKSTLFGDVTIFAGNIAFHDNPEALRVITQHEAYSSKLIQNFDFKSLKLTRVTETIDAAPGNPRVEIHTDFVPFTHPIVSHPSTDQYLLVYSINSRLITMFPVNQSTLEAATNPANLGDEKPIATQYNGFVRDVSGRIFIGNRRVSQP